MIDAVAACIFLMVFSFGAEANPSHNVLVINTLCSEERFYSGSVVPYIQTANDNDEAGFNITSKNTAYMSDVDTLLKGLVQSPPELAVIHPGCFSTTSTLAAISKFFNSTLVTYAFSSFPTSPHASHMRMIPSEMYLADGVVSLLEYFGWRRIVIFSEASPVFSHISNTLDSKLGQEKVNITKISLDPKGSVLFPSDNRIILINAFPRKTRMVLCEGFRKNMYYPSYVWITYEWQERDWWRELQNNSCSDDDIEAMLEGTLVVSHYPVIGNEVEGIPNNFTTYYERFAFDAILALSALVNEISSDERYTSSINDLLDNISFNGTSGYVSFRSGIRQLESVSIKQYRRDKGKLKLVHVAQQPVRERSSFTYISGECNATIWTTTGTDNCNTSVSPPSDGTPLSHTNTPLLSLMVLTYMYATAGIIFALVCLVFNVIFRNKKLIRLTSPNINYIIIFGAIMFYSAAYTFFYPPGISLDLLTALCNIRLWLTSLGFSLCYVPINAKMWRVYHICRKPNPSMKKMYVKDWHLILIVAGFVAADVLALTIITAVESARYSVRSIPDKENPQPGKIDGITVFYKVDRCFSNTELIWLPFIIGYKLVLQVIGVFLAFNIRKVKIKGLNDSKQISLILYVTTFIIIAATIGAFIFGDYINVDGGLFGLGISTATTCVLVFIFVPKMVALYKDPKGKNIFSASKTGQKSQTEEKIVISTLEKKVKVLEQQLMEKKNSSLNITITSSDVEKEVSQSMHVT